MQLAAYYIFSNEFGIKNQTINFGGKYYYDLTKNKADEIVIKREPNLKYIDKFYSNKNLTLVSAIVGRNGSGKTSQLLDIIRCISGGRGSRDILVFEKDEKVLLFFGNIDKERGISGNTQSNVVKPKNFIVDVLKTNVTSVYYSPHLDYKDGVPGLDISIDNILYQDLDEEQNITRFTNPINPIKHHELNNFKRQYLFINSSISKKLYELFEIPKPLEKLKLSFSLIRDAFNNTSYTEFSFHNTPTDIRSDLNDILGKCKVESDRERKGGFVSYQKERLKHYILWGILSLIVDVAERQNTYLEEGRLPKGYSENTKELNSVETFYYFLKTNYYIYPKKSLNRESRLNPNPIPRDESEALIKKLFSVIDNLKAKNERDKENFNWDDICIYPAINDVSEILKLEIAFKEKLRQYYQPAYKSRERLEEVKPFIHVEWYDRKPSSGENAILNLFSRLYTIKDEIESSNVKYYILFIDEGDAGFHPQWKKKYIEILTQILPFLFEKEKVEFQVIFTTHDPLTLSDILSYNISYFTHKIADNHHFSNFDNAAKPSKSFAANISDLLSDSFFVDEGLIGTFSKKKIEETIEWLKKPDENNSEYYKKLIENIDESIVQRKLSEMYDEKMKTNLQKEILNAQIEQLKKQIEQIK